MPFEKTLLGARLARGAGEQESSSNSGSGRWSGGLNDGRRVMGVVVVVVEEHVHEQTRLSTGAVTDNNKLSSNLGHGVACDVGGVVEGDL